MRVADGEVAPEAWPRRLLLESIEKSLCHFEVGRVEPFGETNVHRLEQRQGIGRAALIA
jgi:hypothetical protein